MNIVTHIDKAALGAVAASQGTEAIHAAIRDRGRANVILATGVSQYEMLDRLIAADIDWSRVTVFHLDEYVGLPVTHGASFRKYLRERVMDRLRTKPEFIEVAGDAPDLAVELARLNGKIAQHPIDICFAGIGENGHLAFNDPPADFDTRDPYIVVTLDDACRQQQLGEGWFPDFASVPQRAISMSIAQIMASRTIVLSVSDARKTRAVKEAVEGPVTPLCPASILQRHPNATLHLDPAAASGLAK
jgi:glucosamine-6-phosphate deaminase